MSGPAAGPAGGGAPFPARAVVIGTGLIGTSVALALRRAGVAVWLADADPAAARLAADIGAGTVLPSGPAAGHARTDRPLSVPPGGRADVALLAVPPGAVARTLASAQAPGLARWYTDVASVKSLPAAQAQVLGCDMSPSCPATRCPAGSGPVPPPPGLTCSSAGPGSSAPAR